MYCPRAARLPPLPAAPERRELHARDCNEGVAARTESAMTVGFTNLAIVAAAAFAAPLALGLTPRLRLPAVVLEIVLGIVVGPQALGWAGVGGPVQVLNLIGLAFLLLIAGLEVDFDRLRGRLLRVSGLGFVV